MRQQGFTLIEIMVVVVIIGLLAALVLPRVTGRQDEAMVVKARSDIRALSGSLQMYKLDNFHYPSTDQSIESLRTKPSGEPEPKNWKKGGYVQSLSKDPWGNPYQYLFPGENLEFDVWSFGADGQPGGEGLNTDIGNWNLDGGRGK